MLRRNKDVIYKERSRNKLNKMIIYLDKCKNQLQTKPSKQTNMHTHAFDICPGNKDKEKTDL